MGEYSIARGERFDVLTQDIVPEALDMLHKVAVVISISTYDSSGGRLSERCVS